MNNLFKKNPKLFILFYVIYVLIVTFIAGRDYSFIIQPLIVPITILIGIFIWEWQEDVRNKEAKKQTYIKNYNEKAEKVFGIYTQYEKSIQNLYRHYKDLHIAIKPKEFRAIPKHKEISILIEKIDGEIKGLQGLEVDLYNEAVLLYYLVSNNQNNKNIDIKEINVYQEAHDLINNLCNYKYVSDEIAKLIFNHQQSDKSQADKEMDLISNFYELKPKIEAFNFGYATDSKEVIYIKPRNKFLELTRAQ